MSIVSFYRGEAPDHAGRKIDELWAYSLDDLESRHDFIQWLFPIDAYSPVNPYAPRLEVADARAFQTDPALKANLLKSFYMMLHFYGLGRAPASSGVVIRRGENFDERAPEWLSPGNHNHLRLTRIIRCLHLCGLVGEAQALLAALLDIAKEYPDAVSERTVRFWKGAVR